MARFSYDGERHIIKDLWSVCFDDTPAFVDWNFDKNYSSENTVVAEVDNKVVSAMQMLPFAMRIKNLPFSARGIWGVSTYPEYRNKGKVRELFEYAMPKLYSDGCEICVLVAAVSGMYEKFGFSKNFDINFHRLADKNLRYAENTDDELIERLANTYKSAMSSVAVYVDRTYDYWQKTVYALKNISDGQIALTKDGYALLYPEGGEWIVSEGFGIKTAEITNSYPLMARVINVKSVLERLADFIEDGTVIRIKDDIIAENNICCRISGGEVTECNLDVAEMDISDFTNMIFDLFRDKEGIYIHFPLDI